MHQTLKSFFFLSEMKWSQIRTRPSPGLYIYSSVVVLMRDSRRNYPWNVESAAVVILSWLKCHLGDGWILRDEPERQELLWGWFLQPRIASFYYFFFPFFLFWIKKSSLCSDTTRHMLQRPRQREKGPESGGWVRLTNATAWHPAETGAAKSIPGAISWCLSVYINITWLSLAAFVSTAHLEILPCWAEWGTGGGGEKKEEKKPTQTPRTTYVGI